jgi:hypothetical protein
MAEHTGVVYQEINIVRLRSRLLDLGCFGDVEPKGHDPPSVGRCEVGHSLGLASCRVDFPRTPR